MSTARYFGRGFDTDNFGIFSPPCDYDGMVSPSKAGAYSFTRAERKSPFVPEGDAAPSAVAPAAASAVGGLPISPQRQWRRGYTMSPPEKKERSRWDPLDPARIVYISAAHAQENLGRLSPGPQSSSALVNVGREGPRYSFRKDPVRSTQATASPGPIYNPRDKYLSTVRTPPAHSIRLPS